MPENAGINAGGNGEDVTDAAGRKSAEYRLSVEKGQEERNADA